LYNNSIVFIDEKMYNNYVSIYERRVIMANVYDVAKYIINYTITELEKTISNLKLQKMLYYVQGYSIKELSYPAFDAVIENWPYGPVVPEVYFEYNEFRGGNIDAISNFDLDESELPRKLKRIIEKIAKKCSTMSAFTLVNKTHSEAPWSNTKQNDIISNAIMSDYFNLQDPLNIGDE
jgi:uncharacterized phage-associated protein